MEVEQPPQVLECRAGGDRADPGNTGEIVLAAAADGKPEEIQQKIAEGRMKKWLEEVVLLEQKHVNEEKHETKTIEEMRTEVSATTGENVVIRRFTRFQVGEE